MDGKYFYPKLISVILFVSLFISFFLEKTLISTIIGLLFSLPISLSWLEYNAPILQIKDKAEPVECGEPVKRGGCVLEYPYIAERIVIENKGRSAAKGCKGYIVTHNKERICWTIPDERGDRANKTINVEDNEPLDFFAFKKGVKDKIYAPTEGGWKNTRTIKFTGPINNCKVLVTSENAEPVEANIKIDMVLLPI